MKYVLDEGGTYLVFKPENQMDAFNLGKLASKRSDAIISFEWDGVSRKRIGIKSVAVYLKDVFAILAGLDD